MLSIRHLEVSVFEKPILKDFCLDLPAKEVHVIMGPNGVGKSTLAHTLMGAQNYKVTAGNVFLEGEDISLQDTTQRAQKGLFLAFQYPVAIFGLKVSEYLRNLYNLRHKTQLGVGEFRKILKDKLELLNIERSFLQRYLNDGFSGGETKRFEMLQLLLLQPKIAILDEVDSGVDVDAQKVVARAIEYILAQTDISFLIITHYQRLLNFVKPHKVHVMLEGKICYSGDFSVVAQLERFGYDFVRQTQEQKVSTLCTGEHS